MTRNPLILASAMALSCCTTTVTADVCATFTCSDRGVCYSQADVPRCLCDVGYTNGPRLTCVQEGNGGGDPTTGGDPLTGDASKGDSFVGDPRAGDTLTGDTLSGDTLTGDGIAGDAPAGDTLTGDSFAGDGSVAPAYFFPAFTTAWANSDFAVVYNQSRSVSFSGTSASYVPWPLSGKVYWEVLVDQEAASSNGVGVGNRDAASSIDVGSAGSTGYDDFGLVYRENSLQATGLTTWAAGDVLGVAIDVDNLSVWFAVNGNWISGDPATASAGFATPLPTDGALYAGVSGDAGAGFTINMGHEPFVYAAPSGFAPGWPILSPAEPGAVFDPSSPFYSTSPLAWTVDGNSGSFPSVFSPAIHGNKNITTTTGVSTGKHYMEFEILAIDSSGWSVGILSLDRGDSIAGSYHNTGIRLNGAGQISDIGSDTTFYGSLVFGPPDARDIVMVALDADANKVWFGLNGSWLLAADPATGSGGASMDAAVAWSPAYGTLERSRYFDYAVKINLGQYPLVYAPPAGFPAGFALP